MNDSQHDSILGYLLIIYQQGQASPLKISLIHIRRFEFKFPPPVTACLWTCQSAHPLEMCLLAWTQNVFRYWSLLSSLCCFIFSVSMISFPLYLLFFLISDKHAFMLLNPQAKLFYHWVYLDLFLEEESQTVLSLPSLALSLRVSFKLLVKLIVVSSTSSCLAPLLCFISLLFQFFLCLICFSLMFFLTFWPTFPLPIVFPLGFFFFKILQLQYPVVFPIHHSFDWHLLSCLVFLQKDFHPQDV